MGHFSTLLEKAEEVATLEPMERLMEEAWQGSVCENTNLKLHQAFILWTAI
jgi:hypothetical protein